MKKIFLIFGFLSIAILSFAQEDDYELAPLNWFIRFSTGVVPINARPAIIDFDF
ncbi:MAG: hypothetical protein HC803_08465 [Saprospiraceae bacterium]|nr:hypothetical protein [Saprospiraceae bacterium]